MERTLGKGQGLGRVWPNLREDDTPVYSLEYSGNQLVRIEPRGLNYPYLEGL